MEDNMNATIGIIDILIDTINKKYDYIRDLNSLNVNLSEESFEDMIPVIDSIIEDENNHIGKLQQLVDLLSNSEEDIEEGKQETIEIIDNSDEFVESITSMKKKLVLSENFDNVIDDVQAVADPVFVGANEEHDENKKKYEDAMEENKKTAEETIPDEEDTGKDIKSKELKAMHLSEELFEDLSQTEQWDLNSAVYNAIADVFFKFYKKGLDIYKEDLEQALEFFNDHFWESDDYLEESCHENNLKESQNNDGYHDGKWDIVVTAKVGDSLDRDILLNGTKVGELWDDGTIDLKEPLSDEDKKELVSLTNGEILEESCDKDDLKESIQCAIAKEQIKRFTEGKMPKNWTVDSYLDRLTEKKHINEEEAKSLREWYSTIK